VDHQPGQVDTSSADRRRRPRRQHRSVRSRPRRHRAPARQVGHREVDHEVHPAHERRVDVVSQVRGEHGQAVEVIQPLGEANCAGLVRVPRVAVVCMAAVRSGMAHEGWIMLRRRVRMMGWRGKTFTSGKTRWPCGRGTTTTGGKDASRHTGSVGDERRRQTADRHDPGRRFLSGLRPAACAFEPLGDGRVRDRTATTGHGRRQP